MNSNDKAVRLDRRQAMLGLGAATALGASYPLFAQTGPIKVGGSLAITGPLSATALVHKLTGEIYLEELNKRGGLLGRKVEWVLKDDQSKPDVARTLYEQLVTVDKVDLLIGPYATPNILSAMGVAQRYNKLIIHHTFGMPHLAKYEKQFPTWATGVEPARTTSDTLLDFMASMPNPPKRIAIVTSKFAPCLLVANGMREGVARMRKALPGVRVIGATVVSALGSTSAAHGFKEQDDKRRQLNEFIRTSGVFDGVADFDKVVTDTQTGAMRAEFVPDNTVGGPGDKLHPNRLGYMAMGGAVDLKLLAPR